MVYIRFGSNTGLTTDEAYFISQGDGVGSLEPYDRFGMALASGDLNGDGNDDLAIGSPYEDIARDGGTYADAGALFVAISRALEAPNPDCTNDANHRGFAPFSTLEATALREFAQNYSISMAVVVHSTAQEIWNMWGNNDVAGVAISGLAQWVWAIGLDDPNLFLVRDPVGGGFGQFSAWLSRASNTAGQPDNGTVRAIQTIFVELPFQKDNYKGNYRYRDDDGSNGFHPSGDHVRDLIQDHFIPMAKVLIGQSASPGCNTGYGCPDRDFGLVGAKIGRGSLSAGALTTNAAGCLGTVENGLCDGRIVPARDYLAVGRKYVRYRVQNFSAEAGYDDLDVRMTVIRTINRPDGSEPSLSRTIQSFANLSRQAVAVGRFELNIDRADVDYAVTLEGRPAGGFASGARDGFRPNDKKVFRFRSRQ